MSGFEQIELPDGRRGFRKLADRVGKKALQAEAEGLAAMAATGTVLTPEVLRVSDTELVTEWVGGGSGNREGWARLGESLAAMHALPQPDFGFESDNYCGATPQSNTPTADGWEFFASERLMFQGRLARDAGLLTPGDMRLLESVVAQLRELIPAQGPALLHGDLWRGNVVFDTNEQAYLIDPAVYRGWPEAELGMTLLFGGFAGAFYEAYESTGALEAGWRERTPIYNLYHLLNHLNIFGGGYYSQVYATLGRYA